MKLVGRIDAAAQFHSHRIKMYLMTLFDCYVNATTITMTSLTSKYSIFSPLLFFFTASP